MSKLRVHLLIIDPQKDFMDDRDSALPVPGANEDMRRLAAMINRIGGKLDDILVTLDSHRIIDIAHPAMWRDHDGRPPAPFTIISAGDIEAGIWQPRNASAKPPTLEGRTIGQYALHYAKQLEAGGKYPLLIWPPHCLIGTPGHNVQSDLMRALLAWEERYFASVGYVTKGTNVWTEHFGGLMAEVPMATDPASGLNTDFLSVLAEADIVVVGGEALSHCVLSTVTQIADNIGGEHIQKFHILTDCSSPVPKVGDGPDFPVIAANWLKAMEARGMTLTTSIKLLA